MKSMNVPLLLRCTAAISCVVTVAACGTLEFPPNASTATATVKTVKFQQVRNATIKLQYAGTTFLIDPMLAKKGRYPGFEGTYNSRLRNPLVELPMPVAEVIKADAIIVTHTHLDHWDEAAKESLPKNLPLFAQNEADAASIRTDGFTDVRVLGPDTTFNGTRLSATAGQHGSDEAMAVAGKVLGQVIGVVFQHPGYKTVYVAGDTVWNDSVEASIKQHQPDVIILNTGYARIQGLDGSIIMGKGDLYRAYQAAPKASVIGSHMEAVNHGMQTRKDLHDYIKEKGMNPARVLVPEDGESYAF